MKKIIILLSLLSSLIQAEIKNLDLIFIEGVEKGIKGTLSNAYDLITGEKNITKRMKVYKNDNKEKLLKYYRDQARKDKKNYWNMRHDLETKNRKLRIENEKLKKLLKLHDIDYEHAEIRVELKPKPKKMKMIITDK